MFPPSIQVSSKKRSEANVALPHEAVGVHYWTREKKDSGLSRDDKNEATAVFIDSDRHASNVNVMFDSNSIITEKKG